MRHGLVFKKLLALFQQSKRAEDTSARPGSKDAHSGGSTVEVPVAPEFWYSWFDTFGAIGDPVDENILASAFGVTSDGALRWWNRFTGWYEGVIDEADGHVERPAIVRAEFVAGVALEAEIHPGNIYFSLSDQATRVVIGNIGPHWSLPILSLDEAIALSHRLLRQDAAAKARAFLFFSVGVWLSESERVRAREVFIRSCRECGIVEPAVAPPLAEAWVNAVTTEDYPFYQDAVFGACTRSPWSVRNPEVDASRARTVAGIIGKYVEPYYRRP